MFWIGAGLRGVVDAVAPRLCAGCGAVCPEVLCVTCVDRLVAQPMPLPRRAGTSDLRSAFLFAGPARDAVHAAKYRGRRGAMRAVAAVAAERLGPVLARAAPRPVAVVPVPLAGRRRRARGYNQAEVAAAEFARLPCGGPLDLRLRRRRETAPQVGRDARTRRRNVEDAFAWTGPPFGEGERTVWLVDDVATTGATFAAAAMPLQRAGAGRIEFVAVCGAL